MQEDDKWIIWIVFQDLKYEWDFDSKSFQGIEFPVRHMLKSYLNHKGFMDDGEISNANRKFGKNRYLNLAPNRIISHSYFNLSTEYLAGFKSNM